MAVETKIDQSIRAEVCSTSPDFLPRLLREVPTELEPVSFAVGLTIKDSIPTEDYFGICKERKIIPNSNMEVSWFFEDGLFLPLIPRSVSDFNERKKNEEYRTLSEIKALLLDGKKLNQITYRSLAGGYPKFKEDMEKLLASGYHIHSGFLTILQDNFTQVVFEHDAITNSAKIGFTGNSDRSAAIKPWFSYLTKLP